MRKVATIPRWMRIGVLTAYLTVVWTIAGLLSGITSSAPEISPGDQSAALLFTLLCSLWITGVSSFLILRSYWYGWRLMAAFILAFFGTITLVPQIESVIFLPKQLPPGMVWKIILMGGLTALMFTPGAIVVLRKTSRFDTRPARKLKVSVPLSEWTWKLAAIAVTYVVIYFVFGYYVAFRQSAIQTYYEASDPGTFLRQISATWTTTPWLFAVQALRALVWIGLILPLMRSLRGTPVQTGLAVALLFSTATTQLLLPNPFMPDAVRYIHLVETLPSNMLFGFLVGWLLSRRFTHFPERRYAYASAA